MPVITPLFVYWPNQLANKDAYDSCCEVTLLTYKPGTTPITKDGNGNLLWKNLHDESAGKFDNVHEAMLDFANDPQSKCPKFIRADFLDALKRKDSLLLQAIHEMQQDTDENYEASDEEEDQGMDLFSALIAEEGNGNSLDVVTSPSDKLIIHTLPNDICTAPCGSISWRRIL